jgi:phosphate starvation-inducible protein PhoH and related proteins
MEMSVRLPGGQQRLAVVGASERNLKLLRDALGVNIASRDGKITVAGNASNVKAARRVLELLIDAAQAGTSISRQFVLDVLSGQSEDVDREELGRGGESDAQRAISPALGWQDARETFDDWGRGLNVYVAGKPVRPKTPNQAAYLRAIQRHDLVFGLGPAGTGKTYLAVAAAVHLLKDGAVRRVVLTRPAVEAGEKLGFLPGDLRDKVNPYLRPLFDALNDMMDFATVQRFMESDVVEVCPLAFMRGRTLNQAIIILDEAQNCSIAQLKMFLTRMGHGSKMIVTGDPTQTDLPDGTKSGLLDAALRLRKTEGIAFVGFEKTDVVRHDLVRRVIAAYEGD